MVSVDIVATAGIFANLSLVFCVEIRIHIL